MENIISVIDVIEQDIKLIYNQLNALKNYVRRINKTIPASIKTGMLDDIFENPKKPLTNVSLHL